MTTQVPDNFIYENETYLLLYPHGKGLLALSHVLFKWGVKSLIVASNSAPFRCDYALHEENFILQGLLLGEQEVAIIHGISPVEWRDANNVPHSYYGGLSLPMPFTGKFLAAKGKIPEFIYPLVPLQYFAFETLLEFQFDEGKFQQKLDHSEKMALIRQTYTEGKRIEEQELVAVHQEIKELRAKLDAHMENVPLPRKLHGIYAGLGKTDFPEKNMSDEEIEAKRQAIDMELKPIRERIQELHKMLNTSEQRETMRSKVKAIFNWD